jgi:type II secretory pathway pseudopilin PulG
MKIQPPPISRARAGGFTLIEVLISMGVFLIGIIAVAAIFPSGILVQRRTSESLMSQAVVRNARAKIFALVQSDPGGNTKWISYKHQTLSDNSKYGSLTAYATGEGKIVHSLLDIGTGTGAITSPNNNDFADIFTATMRSYPSNVPVAVNRDYFWYPFIITNNDLTQLGTVVWRAMVMVVRKDLSRQFIPEIREIDVTEDLSSTSRIRFTGAFPNSSDTDNDANNDSLPDWIEPGNWVLDDNGRIHRVVLADADGITVDSAVVGLPTKLFYAVNVIQDPNNPSNTIPDFRGRSPIMRIAGGDGNWALPVLEP